MTLCFWWAIFFLLAMLWELLKAIWWIIPVGVIVCYVIAHGDVITDFFKRHWQKFFISLGALSVIGICVYLPIQYSNNDKDKTNLKDSIEIDAPKIEPIDTAQIIVDQRKDSIFQGNIFGGLRFGISKSEYDRVIRNYEKEYDNQLYVPIDSGGYKTYNIAWIEPAFWHNKLYAVKIRLPYKAYYELDEILEKIYGITKYNRWTWSNVEIDLSLSSNRAYDPSGDKGYGSSFSGLYYEYPGSKSLTSEPGKTYLEYKDLTIYRLEQQESHRKDSIRQAKENEVRELKRQREQAKANKYKENL